ncbi:FHA domain-containing protein [Pseudonocardia sp.]|uniref:FHA domain-containing protein n=1 Tax=Pseudonocardia sp. TaxID=60912 RepID=UPI003D13C1B4
MPDPARSRPQALLVLGPGGGAEHATPIVDRIFVGRECAGIEESRRLIISDPVASRTHFEIRLDHAHDRAFIIDSSTNGTHVNGLRIARSAPRALRPGDRVRVGRTEFEFRSDGFAGAGDPANTDSKLTMARINLAQMMMVVGDLTNYSTSSQFAGDETVASCLRDLYGGLTQLLTRHRGTLNHYAGDALYAVWELEHIPDANELAVDYALAADDHVREVAPGLPLRGPGGAPLRMGWAVVRGTAAVTTLPHGAVSVIGDATNLAFRLSGLAGREGRASVIVAERAREAVVSRFRWGPAERVPTKGRAGEEVVYPVTGRT